MRRKLIALGDENHLTDNFIKYVGSWAKRINGVAHLVCQTGGAFPVFADFESRDAISRHRNEKVMLDMMAVAGKLIAPEVPVFILFLKTNGNKLLPELRKILRTIWFW